jgi:hypothetical protein
LFLSCFIFFMQKHVAFVACSCPSWRSQDDGLAAAPCDWLGSSTMYSASPERYFSVEFGKNSP